MSESSSESGGACIPPVLALGLALRSPSTCTPTGLSVGIWAGDYEAGHSVTALTPFIPRHMFDALKTYYTFGRNVVSVIMMHIIE